MRHIEGADRMQESLLPESLDDYVAADDPVRVIDAYVDTLDLHALGFDKAQPEQTGRKPYNPADLLKLYVYGYLNRVSSSRRLERECARNTEVMWLLRRLRPDFKTIADFRRDNAVALRAACAAFVQFCRRGGLLGGKRVGVDGSRSKAAALERLKRRDERLERFEQAMDAEGYANGEHLQRCEDSAMTATVPRREIPGVPADRIPKAQFGHDAERDCFVCPAGELLTRLRKQADRNLHVYGREGCERCPLRPLCAPSGRRTVTRHYHEAAYERSQARLRADPTLMRQRMAIVERPFALNKQAMGFRRFGCRGLRGAQADMAIAVPGYNLKAMIARLGVKRMLAALA